MTAYLLIDPSRLFALHRVGVTRRRQNPKRYSALSTNPPIRPDRRRAPGRFDRLGAQHPRAGDGVTAYSDMTVDELAAARRQLQRRWSAAFADDDLERMDLAMGEIRAISREIADQLTAQSTR
ncbi:hypothetical protein IF188_09565 [Microbacterium sp. NEAU-LLC]|uniref:Uncharacterized protein n=1 Tax=Microbacterium helvum TaxID=2773713 RepID=A0ABR8NMQ9_9MICO|nr:hypothetical protein [Microbacterium helvum]MBD3941941.1 hypothetical protein [Microbacterium helvum]